MTINVTYFDTRTGSAIKHHRNKDQDLQRRIIGDSLLQFFYGDQNFYTGKLDKYTTAQELKDNKIPGTDLLLSSKGATYYFQDPSQITAKIFPDVTHRAAYGSILLGGCQNSSTGYDKPLQILIIDDLTGENGGYLSLEASRKLTSAGQSRGIMGWLTNGGGLCKVKKQVGQCGGSCSQSYLR